MFSLLIKTDALETLDDTLNVYDESLLANPG
jgi:hypothetical protein